MQNLYVTSTIMAVLEKDRSRCWSLSTTKAIYPIEPYTMPGKLLVCGFFRIEAAIEAIEHSVDDRRVVSMNSVFKNVL